MKSMSSSRVGAQLVGVCSCFQEAREIEMSSLTQWYKPCLGAGAMRNETAKSVGMAALETLTIQRDQEDFV